MRRTFVIPALLLLASPMAACNQGSGDFCGDLDAVLQEVRTVPTDATPAQLEAYYENLGDGLGDMEASAPDDLDDEVAAVQKAYSQATDQLEKVDFDRSKFDPKPFGTPQFLKAATALDDYAREECDINAPTTTTDSGDGDGDGEESTTTTGGDESSTTTTGESDGSSTTVPADETAPSTSTPPV